LKTVLDAWGHVPETWESAYQDWHKSGDENSGTEPDGGAVRWPMSYSTTP
jgi:hypothetical protein